jgi:hypothetical protein
MNVLCRIGMHRWAFTTKRVEARGGRGPVEAVYARCRRVDCRRFSEMQLVHWEGEPSVVRAASVTRQAFRATSTDSH